MLQYSIQGRMASHINSAVNVCRERQESLYVKSTQMHGVYVTAQLALWQVQATQYKGLQSVLSSPQARHNGLQSGPEVKTLTGCFA
jgi:hypothetical protein